MRGSTGGGIRGWNGSLGGKIRGSLSLADPPPSKGSLGIERMRQPAVTAEVEFVTKVTDPGHCVKVLGRGKICNNQHKRLFFCVICLIQARDVVAFHIITSISFCLKRQTIC